MNTTPMIRPATDDRDGWNVYWSAKGEPWRTEPEILLDRQHELAERRDTIKPDVEKGIYPFKSVRLSRADVEWLLHELKPIAFVLEDIFRTPLDLRGSLIGHTDDGQFTNLSGLPLTLTLFGLQKDELTLAEDATVELAAAHLEQIFLSYAHLEGVSFIGAHLEGATIVNAYLQEANLIGAHLELANFSGSHLEKANLARANLRAATLDGAHLEESILEETLLEGARLYGAHLEGAYLSLHFNPSPNTWQDTTRSATS